MQKKIALSVLFLSLAAAIWIIWSSWDSETGWGRILDPKNYKTYHAEKTYLRLSFDYPAEWQIVEDKGRIEPYDQIFVRGPRNAEQTFTATFVVRGQPVRNATGKGRFDTVQHLRENYTTHLYRDPQFTESRNTTVQNQPAEAVTATYIMPPPMSKSVSGVSIPKVETPLKSRAFFTRHGDLLYEFIYSAGQREFAANEAHFDRLIKSIRFKKPAA